MHPYGGYLSAGFGEVYMTNALFLVGVALILAGYWANAAQASQRQAIRIDKENEQKHRR